MKGKTLKYIIFLATVSIAGVFFIQFAFLRSSYNYSDKQFRESVSVALKEVAWQLMLETGHEGENFDQITPVEIINNSEYLVNVDEVIDAESLKSHLIDELKKHEIFIEFEYAIFNPVDKIMGEGVNISTTLEEKTSKYRFKTNNEYINYFAIHFPSRSSYFSSELSIWYFLTALLIIIVLFFGYTLSVIIKQRQLSEIQKNFINNLTHELKTPISSIALSANVINSENIVDSPKRLLKYAQIIQDQNSRLSKNVEKVLNLASLEKSRLHLNYEEIDLQNTLKEITTHFKQSDSGQKANISTNLNGFTTVISADKFHFNNLVTNILENAVKYCEQNPKIEIDLVKESNRWLLRFKDNGIGISKEHRKKIFKKFYRVPTGNVHNVKGFGLGLDYVYKIVKAHGWKIKVDENPEGGSIFVITIPN